MTGNILGCHKKCQKNDGILRTRRNKKVNEMIDEDDIVRFVQSKKFGELSTYQNDL